MRTAVAALLVVAGLTSARADITFEASCPIGCDDNSSHAYDSKHAFEELLLDLSINVSGGPSSPPGYSPISPTGEYWFFAGIFVDGTVTFDPGNGMAPITKSWEIDPPLDLNASWALDLSVPGVFFPTITAIASGYKEWKNGFGDEIQIPYSIDFSWSAGPVTVAPVPVPIAGTGLPGLICACLLWWRRKHHGGMTTP